LQRGKEIEVYGLTHRLKRQRPGQIEHRRRRGVQLKKGGSFQEIGLNGQYTLRYSVFGKQ
jgi:hypothetical protein